MLNIPKTYLKLLGELYKTDHISIEEIHGGGSPRQYFRVKGDGKDTVLCYSQKELDEHIETGLFLKKHHIPVPEIYNYDRENGLILFEDGGTVSLQRKVLELREKKEDIIKLYEHIIHWLLKLQKINPVNCKSITDRIFDHDYYRWETDYFLESCVDKFFHLHIKDSVHLIEEFNCLAETLSKEETVIVHRDFQSQNIYIKEYSLYFLDFQSARLGVCQYDLASLLYDPYVSLEKTLQKELLDYYCEEKPVHDKKHFTDIFYKTSMQRLMQALGAYGFLGIVKGKKDFLNYIDPALNLLFDTVKHTEEFPEITMLIEKLISLQKNLTPCGRVV
ncbi:MAG: phosphotransferase [Candidatus Eremiobacterota bacterium]